MLCNIDIVINKKIIHLWFLNNLEKYMSKNKAFVWRRWVQKCIQFIYKILDIIKLGTLWLTLFNSVGEYFIDLELSMYNLLHKSILTLAILNF